MPIDLKQVKGEIKSSGAGKGKVLFFKDGTKYRVRFLTDFEEGLTLLWHSKYDRVNGSIDVPCQEVYGRDCAYCSNPDLTTKNKYVWQVFDYETEEIKLLIFAANRCSPIQSMAAMYETYGNIIDRDYEIRQIGRGSDKQFSVIPLEKKRLKFKVKPLSEKAVLKYIDKAFPADDSDDEEDERTSRKKQKTGKSKYMNEPEDVDEEEEESDGWEDYDSMSARELWELCKQKDIKCKPRKSKEYYKDLLEQHDEEEEESDGWEDVEVEDEELPFN